MNLSLNKIILTFLLCDSTDYGNFSMNLDSSRVSGPDCIPVVVLKNFESELSYILAELFNMCLKESYFPNCWEVSSVVSLFKNVGERSTAENYRPVSLLSMVSRAVEIIKLLTIYRNVAFFLFPVWF